MFALFFAVLFLATSSTAAVFAILNSVQSKPQDTGAASQQTQQNKGENMLQGTQLIAYTPVASVPELQKIDTAEGTGETVRPGDTVTVDYTGAVAATGIVFQSSKDFGQPATFGLDQVIKGWTEGIPGMKIGGTRRLMIPANLAYGANPPAGSGIPVNADLVFDVTLFSIDKN